MSRRQPHPDAAEDMGFWWAVLVALAFGVFALGFAVLAIWAGIAVAEAFR